MNIDSLIDEEFPLDDELIYLNHAAVAPWPNRTSLAVRQFAEENTRRGAADYAGWVAKETELRTQIKSLIQAGSVNEIALLKNTSEALSVVAAGIPWKAGENIVSTNQEFPSNRIPWQVLSSQGVEFREVDITVDDPEQALMDACDRHTHMMTISSVQYGSGIRMDMPRLGQYCQKNNILFCIDAIQSIGAHAFNVDEYHADFVMADGHKWMLGPEGIALFYCRQDKQDLLELHQYGWHMVQDMADYDNRDWQTADTARRFECGSPNMLGIHALSASLSLLLEVGMATVQDLINDRVDTLISELVKIKNLELITPRDPSHRAGIVMFRINNIDPADLHKKLVQQHVICAHRWGGIRFSPHFYTGQDKINKALEILSLSV